MLLTEIITDGFYQYFDEIFFSPQIVFEIHDNKIITWEYDYSDDDKNDFYKICQRKVYGDKTKVIELQNLDNRNFVFGEQK